MLNKNPIGDEGMAAMAAALGGGGTKLRSASFGEVAISDDGVKELAAALAKGAPLGRGPRRRCARSSAAIS